MKSFENEDIFLCIVLTDSVDILKIYDDYVWKRLN